MTSPVAEDQGRARDGDRGPSPSDLLEAGLGYSLGRPVRIIKLQRRSHELSSHPVERLWVSLDGGERIGVVFKRLTSDVRPEAHGSRREVLVYRRLLAGRRFGAPEVYASAYDEGRKRYWLFLEDVGQTTLKKGGIEEWFASVRLLAEMHGTYLGRERELRDLGFLAEHDAGFYEAIAEEARRNLKLAGDRRSLARFDGLMRPFGALAAELAQRPRTLVHGDIFPKNLATQPGGLIRPLDWESAGIGSPLLDLVRLTDGWDSDKPRFIDAYLDHLGRKLGGAVDRGAFFREFDQFEVVNILWTFRWSVDHCRDARDVSALLDRMESILRLTGGRGGDG